MLFDHRVSLLLIRVGRFQEPCHLDQQDHAGFLITDADLLQADLFCVGNNGLSALSLVEMTVLDGSVCDCVCACVCVEVTTLGRCSTAVSKIPPKCLPL